MNFRQFLSMCQSNTIYLKVIDVNTDKTIYSGGFTHFAIIAEEDKYYESAYVVFFAIETEDNTLVVKIRLH